MRCPWVIHWGALPSSLTQCDKDAGHPGLEHEGPGLPEFSDQRIKWYAGDRREFMGFYPGPCLIAAGTGACVLPAGHHGDHAP